MSPLSPYLHSDEWHEDRVSTLRASDVKCLVEGDGRRIRELWRIKTGRTQKRDHKPSLAALMGQALEDLNRRYFMTIYERDVWGESTKILHPDHPWIGASLDGITTASDGREAYLELKAVSFDKDIKRLYDENQEQFRYLIAYRKWQEEVVFPLLIKEYTAQCHVAMACGGWSVAVLCAIIGNRQFVTEIEFDPFYWMDLFALMEEFWWFVTNDKRPTESVMRGLR